MNISISEHFNYKKILRFVIPSIFMMVFISLYGVVDGIFVSNFVGKTPFAGLNLIMPVLMMFGMFGFMIGQGGCAIVSATFGAGDPKRANRYFSMLVYLTIGLGIFLCIIGQIVLRGIAGLLGAEGELLECCVQYGRIYLIGIPFFMLQSVLQNFLIAAERPKIALYVTLGAGFTNIILDFLLVGVFSLGLVGAALATIISQGVGAICPLIYFLTKNSSILRLGKATFDFHVILKTVTNGSSELMTNISMSVVNTLYNTQLLKYFGEDGVSAYGVIMYVSFVFVAMFIGYSMGVAPIVGFNYGAKNDVELKNIFKKSLRIIICVSVGMVALAQLLAPFVSHIFVGYDEELYKLTLFGFRIHSLAYLFAGINIFASSFFTALNNGVISAIISFLRTLLFQVVLVMVLPLIFGANGIWFSVVAADILATVNRFFPYSKQEKIQLLKQKTSRWEVLV